MLSSLQKLPGFRLLIIQNKMCTFGRSCLNWGSLQVEKENKAGFDKKKVSTWTWFGWNCTQLSVPCEQTKSSFEEVWIIGKKKYIFFGLAMMPTKTQQTYLFFKVACICSYSKVSSFYQDNNHIGLGAQPTSVWPHLN